MLIQGAGCSQARGAVSGQKPARQRPLPAASCSLHAASVLPQLYLPRSLFICFSLPTVAHNCLCLLSPGAPSRGVSRSILPAPLPTPSSHPPAPTRPASKPGEATSVLNPKSFQLNRSLRLRRLLLTSGEPGEAKAQPTRWGWGRRRPPSGAPRSSVCPPTARRAARWPKRPESKTHFRQALRSGSPLTCSKTPPSGSPAPPLPPEIPDLS